jgi:hypothetical protein
MRILGWTMLVALVSGCVVKTPSDASDDVATSDDDESSDDESDDATTSETGGPLVECELTDLDLTEDIGGYGALGWLDARGSNAVTSSCGGGGVDSSYLLSAEVSSYYRVYASSQDGEPLNYHVHAGDSCHAPELLCMTTTAFEQEFMLEAGESIVIVVDTASDQVIPPDGLAFNVGVTWSDGPPQPCQDVEVEACYQDALVAVAPCLESAACGEFATSEACYLALGDGLEACHETLCPDGPSSPPWDSCYAACKVRSLACKTELGCDPNDCEYDEQLCGDACRVCDEAIFELDYAGSCELALPGPPGPLHLPFIDADIGGQDWWVAEPGVTCDHPREPGGVWSSESVLQLCTNACEAFVLSGHASVRYGVPPCE